MNRILTTLCIILFATGSLWAQNAFYDGLMIYDISELHKKKTNDTDRTNLIKHFAPNHEEILRKLIANPFDANLKGLITKEFLQEVRDQYEIDNTFVKAGIPGLGLSGASVPASYQSMVIDALAKIVAEDLEQGINTLYINKFKERLEEFPFLKALFPQTYQFFLDTNPFDYPKLGNEFRAKFEADLDVILRNAIDYIKASNEPYLVNFRATKFYKPFIFSADIGEKLVQGYHPTEILDFLESTYSTTGFEEYYKTVKFVNLVQRNFQRGAEEGKTHAQFENIWLRYDDLKRINNPEKAYYVIGLLYQQDVDFFDSVFKNELNIFAGATSPTADKVYALFTKNIKPSIELFMFIENLQHKKELSGNDLGQMLTQIFKLLQLNNMVTSVSQTDANEMFKKVGEIYDGIAAKDYTLVIPDLVFIIETIAREANGGADDVKVLKVTASLMKYGTFAVNVVNAKTSDELKDAYRKAALPRGTFLDKRTSLSSLTLSAHPGVFGGIEDLGKKNTEPLVGITAPIGFEFTWGFRKKIASRTTKDHGYAIKDEDIKKLSGSNFGIMLQVLDIGAVFNYRLNDSESELPEEFTFKQVFSPGAAFHYGFRKTPITLGAGYQYTPELRKVTTDGATKIANSSRIFLRLTWDIPLLKIYYKKERIKK